MSGRLRGLAELVLTRLGTASARERVLLSVAALVMAVLVGTVLILVAGVAATCGTPAFTIPGVGGVCYNPVAVYYYLAVGSIGSAFGIALTLKEMTLLLFTGLSVAVAFRAGLFNIGTQGQLVLGGLATALVVLWTAPLLPAGLLGGLLLVVVGLAVGAVVGGLYGALPGALKAYADANEVITTIMFNFIAAKVALYLVSAYFQDPGSQSVQTVEVADYAQLQPVFFTGDFSVLALVIALVLALGVFLLLETTPFGYDLRTSGLQPEAAEYGGVDAKRTIVSSMALSGALGGLGGAVWVLMVAGRWHTGVPALGFDGITVSILAGNNPLGVVPAALLFGGLKSGSLAIKLQLGVPKQLVGVLRGLIILFVAMPEFFRMLGRSWGYGTDDQAVAADGGGGESR